MRYTFEPITQRSQVKGICKHCGKRRTRVLTGHQTVNPFNRRPDGITKSRQEVIDSVMTELAEKIKALTDNFLCATCAGNQPEEE